MTTQQVQRGGSPPRKRRTKSDLTTSKNVKNAVSYLVEDRIARIEKCHSIGSKILKRCPEHAAPNEMQALAVEYEIPEGATRRFRQIAKMFTLSELDGLYDQFRTVNFAFTVTHFFVLIGVHDRKTRKKLIQTAVEEKLNITELRRLKLRTECSTRPGGRRPAVVTLQTGEDLHAAINFEAAKWHRWLEHLLEKRRSIKPALRKRLSELSDLVKKVRSLSSR